MPNKNENQKLDELVKQRISNYEPVVSSPDWTKMESLLGLTAKSESHSSSSFNSPDFSAVPALLKKLLSSYVFIALIMLIAGAAIFYFILKSPTTNTENNTTEQLQNVDTLLNDTVTKLTKTVAVSEEKKEVAPTESDSVKKVNAEKLAQDLKEKAEAEEKQKAIEQEEIEKKEAEEKKEKEKNAKEERKKEEKKKADKKEAERKEKEKKAKLEKDKKEQPKESLKKSNNPIGLGNLMRSVNLDSIKKIQEQQETPKPANDSTQR